MNPWERIKLGYLRLIAPLVDWLVTRRVNPNLVTTLGTVSAIVSGAIYASGHIRLAGWVFGITAVFDAIDGEVARRQGRSTRFGAFYDSSLDRISDGAVLAGLAIFFARNGVHQSIPAYMTTAMVVVSLLGMIGAFLTSYTRARAEGLGLDAKVGMLQRPERIVLLSAPQAFFGLALGGWVLMSICVILTLTAWITVAQRIAFVYRACAASDSPMPEFGAARPSVAHSSGRDGEAVAGRRSGDVGTPQRLDAVR
jgi:CDP-diacylglycerol--glycerol-3-phosphate 3-phosphatidyltransferase